MNPYGFCQIAVAIRTFRHMLSKPWQYGKRINIVQVLQGLPYFGKLQNQQFASGFQHSIHFRQSLIFMSHIPETEGYYNTIEIIVGKGQFFRITNQCRNQHSPVQEFVTPTLQHCFINVGQPDFALVTDLP